MLVGRVIATVQSNAGPFGTGTLSTATEMTNVPPATGVRAGGLERESRVGKRSGGNGDRCAEHRREDDRQEQSAPHSDVHGPGAYAIAATVYKRRRRQSAERRGRTTT